MMTNQHHHNRRRRVIKVLHLSRGNLEREQTKAALAQLPLACRNPIWVVASDSGSM